MFTNKDSLWPVIANFVQTSTDYQESRRQEAVKIAESLNESLESDNRWEPFLFDLSEHPSLKNAREERYSDYLVWILDRFGQHTQWLSELLKIKNPDFIAKHEGKNPDVRREVPVDEGHVGQSGRADIVLLYQDVCIDLEVKITDAESADLEKNDGYRNSFERLYPKTKYKHFHRLLVTSAREEYYNKKGDDCDEWYHPITWKDVCLQIRDLIHERKAVENALFTGTVLGFVGSVEQILLGYRFVEGERYTDRKTILYLEELLARLRGEKSERCYPQ